MDEDVMLPHPATAKAMAATRIKGAGLFTVSPHGLGDASEETRREGPAVRGSRQPDAAA
jgi:hypothetical protein